jgi:hypothetical protein
MSIKPLLIKAVLTIGSVLSLAGCDDATSADNEVDRKNLARNALVITQAESVAIATSALRSLDDGDVEVARSTLKAHLQSGVIVLRELRTGKEGAQAAMIDESIRDAEAYLKEQKQ